MSIYVTYLVVAAILVVAELFYFRIADKCNIIDKPNQRSWGLCFVWGRCCCGLSWASGKGHDGLPDCCSWRICFGFTA